jgi:hypothetical protein
MDTKITLSFDKDTIEAAKAFAAEHNMSLSRLTELLYRKITEQLYPNLEELPVSDWVNMVAEGQPVYTRKSRSRKELKEAYHSSKK